jgi:hypothetical protein
MDERRDTNRNEVTEMPSASAPHTSRWLIAAVIALVVAAGLAMGYGYDQRQASSGVSSDNASMNATVQEMQSQINSLTAKLNEVSSAPPAPQPAVDAAAAKQRTAAENKRIKQLRSQLTDQQQQLNNTQQQLKDTQDQVAQQGANLEGNINSTRDELNGSIARTHDELVALEQKGERSFFEFDIVKAKHFQRLGPLNISLRRADPKHKNYDLAMIVDDNQLSKKHVNLYEPIWIDGADSQQVQVVVNKIDKDHIHGYVSAPKYSQSASLTPASAHTNDTTPTEPAVNQSTSTPTSPSGSSDTNSSSPTTRLPQ